ncbi:phosphodiester glycosidase family protein [Brevibacillus fluminis]|uniref:phosphodiester glycosidase family protein n=1 Tax=Brevibacillus fluminis TaxID=511487 RepID=UPI003F88F69B
MKKHKVLSLVTAGVIAWGAIFPLAANVAEARVVTSPLSIMWQQTIGEGATLIKYTKSFGDQQVTVFVTKADLNNQYLEVKPVYGTGGLLTQKQTVTQMARETGAISAINADFFNMTKRGAPFGQVLKDGEIISSMGQIDYWYSLGITDDKTAAIEHFTFSGKVTAPSGVTFPLRGINKEEYNTTKGKSHLDQLNMYTPKFGKTSLGPISGYQNIVEVVFDNNVAKEVRINQPAATIPPNGYVLWGQGAAANFLLQQFPVGSTAQIDYQNAPTDRNWMQAVGGQLLLVNQGKAITSFNVDSSVKGLNARTAVGVSQDGKTMYMVAVDTASSSGLSLEELAQIMVEIGAYKAVNFDGGGSTTMSARMLGETDVRAINTPKGGAERRVPTGLAIYNTAPPGDLLGFQINGPTEVLIGQAAEFTTKAYDTHYLPYTIKPDQINWQVGADAGTFEQNKFIPSRSGTTTITATVGNVSQKRDVSVITGKDIEQIIVGPNPINIAPGQTLGLDIKLKTKKGQMIAATPKSVTISVDSPSASVDDNLQLIAGDQVGKANLKVTYDGLSTTVPVNIGAFEQPWLTFDNQPSMYHTAYPDSLSSHGSFAAVSAGGNDPVFRTKKAAKLTYNFAGAPESDSRIAYGRLGSKPEDIPGKPFGMGLWVYGDSSNHWLRAEVLDAKGKVYYVDLAKRIDWTGWQQVKGYFPAAAVYPLQLRSIYVVDPAENNEILPESGTVYFDEASLLYPAESAVKPSGKTVQTNTPGTLSLGAELDMSYSFAATSSFLDTVSLGVNSIINQQLPGYVPADYAFTVKPGALKAGKQDQFGNTTSTVKLAAKNWIKGKGIGLLYVNEANQTFDPLIGQVDEQGKWVYPINAYGTYIPYYLDKPADVPFVDIINHPAKDEITYMAQKGLVKGITNELFGPENSLTRAQFVTLLARVFAWELPAKPKLSFKDTIPDYAQGPVQVALTKGLVKGYTDKTFRPDQAVTRAEAAVILDRILQKKAQPAQAPADRKAWPQWASAAINNVAGQGLMDSQNGKFEPNKPTTRSVTAVALYRILQQKK